MICNQNTKNGEKVKLLAVVAALVMVVCAIAVVLPSETVAVPETPKTAPFGEETASMYDAETGVYTITGQVTIDLAEEGMNLGTAAQPLDIQFVIQSGGSVTFTNSGDEQKTVYINHTSPVNTTTTTYKDTDKSTFIGPSSTSFGAVTVGQKVVLNVAASLDSGAVAAANESIHIFTNINLTLEAETPAAGQTAAVPGGQVVMSQAENVNGVSWYYGELNANAGSVITLNQSNGISNVKLTMNNATMNIVDPNKMAINPAAGSRIDGSTITSNSSSGSDGYLNVAQNITITDSKVDLGAANLLMTEGYTIDASGSTITTDGEFQYLNGKNDDDVATIKGATLNGNFTGNYTLEDVTFQDAQVSEGATVMVTGNASGTLNSNGTVITNFTDDDTIDKFAVNGGTVQNNGAVKTSVEDGTDFIGDDGRTYTAISFRTSQNNIVTFGVAHTIFNGQNIAGTSRFVDVIEYNNAGSVDIRFITLNEIYEKFEDAEADNQNYGNVTNAGSYSFRMEFNYTDGTISGTTFLIGTLVIDPAPADVTIVGSEAVLDERGQPTGEYKIPDQFYNGGEPVVLVPDVDFKVYMGDSEIPLVYGTDYTVTYNNNVDPTNEDSLAEVVVNLIGNYEGSDSANYNIVQKLDKIDATSGFDAYFVGQYVDISVTGTYENGDSAGTLTAYSDETKTGDYTFSPAVVTNENIVDGKITITVTYVHDETVTDTIEVPVYGIEKIEVTEPEQGQDPSYQNKYTAGDDLVTTGMVITVTYLDENKSTAIFTSTDNVFKKTDGTITSGDFSNEFIFDPETFDTQVGNVTVTVTYYGAEDTFQVTVSGFIATYMVGDVVYGTQVGDENEFASIFNYIGDVPTGQSFTGWMVGDTGAIYQPGAVYKFGEDKAMWADGVVTFYAQFGTGTTTGGNDKPVTESGNILVSVVSTEAGVDVYLIGLDGGYIPAGTITVTCYYTYYIDYGGVQIPASGSTPLTFEITEPSEGFVLVQSFSFVGVEHSSDITNVKATFGDLSSEMIVYTPAQTATA